MILVSKDNYFIGNHRLVKPILVVTDSQILNPQNEFLQQLTVASPCSDYSLRSNSEEVIEKGVYGISLPQ